jgi:hypothetical protein
MDHYSGRSTVDSRPGQGDALVGACRVAATEGGSSPWEHLLKEGAEGTSPWVKGGITGRSKADDEEQWWRWLKLNVGERRHGEAKQRVGQGAVGCCSARVPFIGHRAERMCREAGGQ